MNIKQIIKPSNLTAVGLLMSVLPVLIEVPAIIQKIGAGFIVVGTILFFMRR